MKEELEQEVVKRGGVEERSAIEELKAPKQFPSDYVPFFPKRTPEEIIEKTIKVDDLNKRRQVPNDLEGLDVLISPVSVNGRTMCRLTTTFQQDNDANFAGAVVWIKGYMTDNALADYDENNPLPNEAGADGTLPFQKLATITRSPSIIYLECTSEKVIIGVEAINNDGIGSGIGKMPSQTIELL